MGWKDKQCVRRPPNHLKQKSTCWSHAGGHWQTPKHVGQDFLKRKLPLLNQNMLVKSFFRENCHF